MRSTRRGHSARLASTIRDHVLRRCAGRAAGAAVGDQGADRDRPRPCRAARRARAGDPDRAVAAAHRRRGGDHRPAPDRRRRHARQVDHDRLADPPARRAPGAIRRRSWALARARSDRRHAEHGALGSRAASSWSRRTNTPATSIRTGRAWPCCSTPSGITPTSLPTRKPCWTPSRRGSATRAGATLVANVGDTGGVWPSSTARAFVATIVDEAPGASDWPGDDRRDGRTAEPAQLPDRPARDPPTRRNAHGRRGRCARCSASTNLASRAEPGGLSRGVGRRLELKGELGGVVVLDDYGHHPTAIAQDARGGSRRSIPAGRCGPSTSRSPTTAPPPMLDALRGRARHGRPCRHRRHLGRAATRTRRSPARRPLPTRSPPATARRGRQSRPGTVEADRRLPCRTMSRRATSCWSWAAAART